MTGCRVALLFFGYSYCVWLSLSRLSGDVPLPLHLLAGLGLLKYIRLFFFIYIYILSVFLLS